MQVLVACVQINSVESKRMDTTIMLIGVVVIFFICQLPALVSRAIWAFEVNPRASFTRISLYTLNEFANFLIVLNSSINIVPYYFFGHRFRREFLSLFCWFLFKRRESQTSLFTWSFSRRDSCLVENGWRHWKMTSSKKCWQNCKGFNRVTLQIFTLQWY